MSKPTIVVAGHCTIQSAKLLAVFESPFIAGSLAHLSYRVGKLTGRAIALLTPAEPYSFALFELSDIPPSINGSILEYSIDVHPVNEDQEYSYKLKLLPSGRPLRIAIISCNGVYRMKDENRRYILWKALKEQIQLGYVDLVIHAGDQIYADAVTAFPGENLTAEYRRIYVETWKTPDLASVLSSCPSLMMWDDHDIFDGYGSHGDDSSELAQTIFLAAKTAFREFQAQKNPPPLEPGAFSFAVQYGQIGILALDGRSNRMWTEGKILGDAQIRKVEQKLLEFADHQLQFLLVTTAVPFLHVPVMSYLKLLEYAGSPGGLLEDLRDSWTAFNNREEGKRVLSALFSFCNRSPGTQVFLLSGDVHVGTVGSVRSKSAIIHQIVSSGIGSPPPYGIVRMLLRWAAAERVSLFDEFEGQLYRLQSPDQDFLLAKRNFAILDLADAPSVEFFADYNGRVERFRHKFQ